MAAYLELSITELEAKTISHTRDIQILDYAIQDCRNRIYRFRETNAKDIQNNGHLIGIDVMCQSELKVLLETQSKYKIELELMTHVLKEKLSLAIRKPAPKYIPGAQYNARYLAKAPN